MNESSLSTAFRPGKRILHACFVCLVILLAIWQITLFQNTLKWDAIDITLPWRYFVSDCLYGNWQLPWWNPFQHQGFAQGLSLESWYPLAHLLSIARNYDLYSLNLEYILHLLIASYGFYRFARALGIPHQGSIWGAMVFPLSGFFIANAQHTGWIASGAWTPHVLASFIYWLERQNLKNALTLTMGSFLLVSGGYVAYTIVISYVFMAFWIYHFWRKLSDRRSRLAMVWNTARLLLGLLTCLSVLIVALWSLREQIDRGEGLSGNAIFKGSLYFKHLISLVLPYSTVKGGYDFWHGDQSMMNVYLGLPALMLLILSIKRLDQSFFRFWWLMAIVGLGLSLAVELPFRRWLNVLPLFDLFRFPSLFRYFGILALTIIASKMIGDHPYPNVETSRLRNLLLRLSFVFVLIFALALVILTIRDPGSLERLSTFSIKKVTDAMSFQLVVHVVLLLIFLVTSKLLVSRTDFFKILLFFTALDLIVSCQLNGRVSIFSEHPFSEMQRCLDIAPRGYPFPSTSDLIGSNGEGSLQSGSIYRNTNTVYKRIGYYGYTPYQYRRYIEFEKTPYFAKSMSLPALFVSRPLTRAPGNDFDDSYPILNLESSQFRVKDFGPNKMVAMIDMPERASIVYNQNYTDKWKVTIDGIEAQLMKVDHSLMGVHVPAGKHQIHFYYEGGHLLNALLISLVSLLLFSLLYLWLFQSSMSFFLLLGIGLLVSVRLITRPIATTLPEIPHNNVIFNLVDQFEPDTSIGRKVISDRFLDRGDLERFVQIIENQKQPFSFVTRRLCPPQTSLFTQYLKEHQMIADSFISQDYQIYYCTLNRTETLFQMTNRFEIAAPHWSNTGVNLILEEDNTHQSLKGIDYGATFQLDLTTLDWSDTKMITIEVDYRNQEPIEASLIFSLQDQRWTDLIWKSQEFAEENTEAPAWQHMIWQLPVLPDWSYARYLNAYVWNKGKTDLDIDNIRITINGHGNDD
ncbi:MAG: hypothetical protein IPL46_35070 [Saprospiraceae bacterium]|nr:hypothetical protein [Saprospiraceae bacterium]